MTEYKTTVFSLKTKKDEIDYAQQLKDSIATALKKVMADRGINQTALSNLVGIKKSQMSRILSGKMNLTLSTLEKIGQGLNQKWTIKANPQKEEYSNVWNSNNKNITNWKETDNEYMCFSA